MTIDVVVEHKNRKVSEARSSQWILDATDIRKATNDKEPSIETTNDVIRTMSTTSTSIEYYIHRRYSFPATSLQTSDRLQVSPPHTSEVHLY